MYGILYSLPYSDQFSEELYVSDEQWFLFSLEEVNWIAESLIIKGFDVYIFEVKIDV